MRIVYTIKCDNLKLTICIDGVNTITCGNLKLTVCRWCRYDKMCKFKANPV